MKLPATLLGLGLCLGLSLALPTSALAHERRDVGKYTFVVGFLNEPAYEAQLNGLDLTITTRADNKPVEGAEKTLKAEVIVGGNARSMPLTLTPRFRQPGKYVGDFMPTASGSYIFRIYGTLEGENVDQRFESGPGRFDDVQPISALQFPQKLPDAAAVQAQVNDAQAAAATARTLALAGIGVGVLGLVVAVVAIVQSREARAGAPYAREATRA